MLPIPWQYQEAKAKLSQVMDQVQKEGIQSIIRNRTEVYVILTKEKYDECTRPKSSLVDFFLKSPLPEIEIEIERSSETLRDIDL